MAKMMIMIGLIIAEWKIKFCLNMKCAKAKQSYMKCRFTNLKHYILSSAKYVLKPEN